MLVTVLNSHLLLNLVAPPTRGHISAISFIDTVDDPVKTHGKNCARWFLTFRRGKSGNARPVIQARAATVVAQ